MKMFLTRLGFNSKAVITGDITQIDLPAGKKSGLIEALEVCGKIDGIGIAHFTEKDVVRHNLVQQIIRAYEEYDGTQPQRSGKAINTVNGKPEARATEPGTSQIKEIN
jgi:phosphate starvation-inducible PhoH-like protein